jgi:hypothetical protein
MTILKKVKGGWINVNHEDLYYQKATMITQERKSKYKHKVMFSGQMVAKHSDIQEWCKQSFGPGGRSKKLRWRFGWTDKNDTYYFKSSKDAMLFTLRWSI